ncbi:SurA N-terminal domain-containing protein [Herpetosiphon sp. NSE202]|uniref:SurA N-terminal domain-containing protein n=1 Tax=Herpetosiphon sp. NSE202 TaxID=3351349 RepID=UPI00362AF2E9
MAKNDNVQPAKPMTKRQRARWDQERKQSSQVLLIAAAAVGLAVLLIGIGLVIQKVIVPNKTVASVAGVEVSNAEYQQYRQIMQAQQAVNLAQQIQQYAQYQLQGTEQFATDVTNYIAGLKDKNAPLDYAVLDQLINDKVLENSATAEGITVSDEELQQSLAAKFAPANEVMNPVAPVTSTNGLTDTASLTPTQTPTPTLSEASARVDSAITTYFGTLREFIEETSSYGLATLPFDRAAFKDFVLHQERLQLLRKKLGEKLVTEDQATKEIYADAQQIFVTANITDPTDPLTVTKWAQAKTKIDDVAAQLTSAEVFTDVQVLNTTDNATDNPTTGMQPLTQYAALGITEPISTQEVGVIGEPYQSAQGWHIVLVHQRELRPSQSDLATKRDEAVTKWVEEKRATSNVQQFPEPTATTVPPTIEPIPTTIPQPTTDPAATATPASEATPTTDSAAPTATPASATTSTPVVTPTP